MAPFWPFGPNVDRLKARCDARGLIGVLNHSKATLRFAAVDALRAIDDTDVVKPLITALRDPEHDVREAASAVLGGWVHKPSAVKEFAIAFVDFMIEATNTRTDRNIESLGLLANLLKDSGDSLIALLKDTDSTARVQAAQALGFCGSDRAVEPLITALSDRDPKVRFHVAQSLGKLKNPTAIKPLRSLLNDTDPGVRERADRAIKQLAEA